MMYRNIRAELVRKGWNQSDLADALHMSAPQISMRMRKQTEWTFEEAVNLKRVLDCGLSLEELFRWSED